MLDHEEGWGGGRTGVKDGGVRVDRGQWDWKVDAKYVRKYGS